MPKYTIIAVNKEEVYPDNTVRFTVIYRDNDTGAEHYFANYLSQMHSAEESQVKHYLYEIAYSFGGVDLSIALEKYFFSTSQPVQDWSWAVDSSFQLSKKGIPASANSNPDIGPPRELESLPGLSHLVNHPGTVVDTLCSTYSNARLKTMIIHLNDYHKWTRERIADWLDEISDPTGETGPDLRFGVEPAKVESVDGWKDIGYTTDHKHHVHASYDDIWKSYDALKDMHMEIKLKDINPEIIKLLMGESNE